MTGEKPLSRRIHPAHRAVIVIGMDRSPPWDRIFLDGQLPTWIQECKRLGIPVVALESIKPRRRRRFDEKIWVWRHDPLFGVVFRIILWSIGRLVPLRYHGWEEKTRRERNELDIILEKSISSRTFFARRNRAFLEWISENPQYEWVYRVHSSSFVHPHRFLNFLDELPMPSALIGGQFQVDEWGREYLSGAGVLFSRQAALELLSIWGKVRRDLPEDVGITLLAKKLGLVTQEIQRIDIDRPSRALVAAKLSDSVFHFRCKSTDRPWGDIRIMQLLSHFFDFKAGEKQPLEPGHPPGKPGATK